MANALTKLKQGKVFQNKQYSETLKANGAISLWNVVILIAPATGEELPRVGTTTSAGSRLAYGIVVGPQRNSGLAADAAGDVVEVQPFSSGGLCKYIAEGTVAAFDPLETSATAGALQTQTAIDHAVAYAEGDADTMEKKSTVAVAIAIKAQTDGEVGLCHFARGVSK
jgi:hypothetical protein